MHTMTFFPLGNADCCLIKLANGRRLLFDYADTGGKGRGKASKFDLAAAIRSNFGPDEPKELDVVAFTHGDKDHVQGAEEFFYLEHAKKYQGKDRVKIKELWVPAAFIVDPKLDEKARVLQAEARYRLRNGKRVRIFGRPERLKQWMTKDGLNLAQRKQVISDAGTPVPGITVKQDSLEVFPHSPFAYRNADRLEDRNDNGLVVQLTFCGEKKDTRVIMGADTEYDAWNDIVEVTQRHMNYARLEWDIFKISHHCSYQSLAKKKGKTKTTPTGFVEWLFDQGNKGARLISSSKPIPACPGSTQPPHPQAAAFYREVAGKCRGEFIVTMTHATAKVPEPLIIDIK